MSIPRPRPHRGSAPPTKAPPPEANGHARVGEGPEAIRGHALRPGPAPRPGACLVPLVLVGAEGRPPAPPAHRLLPQGFSQQQPQQQEIKGRSPPLSSPHSHTAPAPLLPRDASPYQARTWDHHPQPRGLASSSPPRAPADPPHPRTSHPGRSHPHPCLRSPRFGSAPDR